MVIRPSVGIEYDFNELSITPSIAVGHEQSSYGFGIGVRANLTSFKWDAVFISIFRKVMPITGNASVTYNHGLGNNWGNKIVLLGLKGENPIPFQLSWKHNWLASNTMNLSR